MLQAGVILSDYATLMVEILKDNARGEAGRVYAAIETLGGGDVYRWAASKDSQLILPS
jgi:hypothetical protein